MRFLKNKLLVFVTVVSLILILTIVLTSQGRTRPVAVERVFGGVITPVQRVVFSIGQFFGNTFSSLTELRSIKKENELLREEVSKLRVENSRLEPLRLQNNMLRNFMNFMESRNDEKSFVANVTGKEPGNWYDVYSINKGSKDGVEINDAIVVGPGYLVGKVIEVSTNYSKFIALIDQRSSVSIVVNRTRDLGIVSGSYDNEIIAIMPLEADVAKEDIITTSGYSTYPKDLYIGKVKKVEKQDKKLQKLVFIEAAADFTKLEIVLVLKTN